MHLKVPITLFQKMVWFIATVHEILEIKISKTMLTQQKFNKTLRPLFIYFIFYLFNDSNKNIQKYTVKIAFS